MDKDLAEVSQQNIHTLAQMFIKESEEASFDRKKPEIYKKWFAIDPQFQIENGFPMRSGYLLGLRVVEKLAKKHSLNEMVHWNGKEIHANVKIALSSMSI